MNIYANIDSKIMLIQQNKRILEVFKNDGVITGVSIEEDTQESMELIYAVTNGSIYLGLVDATGYQSTEGTDPTYSPYDTTYSGNTDLDNHVESESDAEETEAETQEETVADENAVFTP